MQTQLELALMRAKEAERLYAEMVERYQHMSQTIVEIQKAIEMLCVVTSEYAADPDTCSAWPEWMHLSEIVRDWKYEKMRESRVF